jgi:ureidoglycolate lyase
MRTITARPLTAQAFAPFGQVIEIEGARHYPINAGMTERFHDLARIELAGPTARPLISIFRGQPYELPLTLSFMERHPLGSQAFYPLSGRPFLVVVAPDQSGRPGRPQAFLTAPGQGVNMAMNTWHGVLTPLDVVSDFLVIDRGGDGVNIEEFTYAEPWTVLDGR